MAKEPGKGNDWGAGIAAIGAALLFGAALPVGLYFGAYKPQTNKLAAEKKRYEKAEGDFKLEDARRGKVESDKTDVTNVQAKLTEVQKLFSTDVGNELVLIREKARLHGLKPVSTRGRPLDDRRIADDLNKPVGDTGGIGLVGDMVRINCQGYLFNFCSFLGDLESYGLVAKDDKGEKVEATGRFYVVRSVVIKGDGNGGSLHTFELELVLPRPHNMSKLVTTK
jgi:hypothetical protein